MTYVLVSVCISLVGLILTQAWYLRRRQQQAIGGAEHLKAFVTQALTDFKDGMGDEDGPMTLATVLSRVWNEIDAVTKSTYLHVYSTVGYIRAQGPPHMHLPNGTRTARFLRPPGPIPDARADHGTWYITVDAPSPYSFHARLQNWADAIRRAYGGRVGSWSYGAHRR